MKKLKEITVLQWAYIVLGGLVAKKILSSKVSIEAKNTGVVAPFVNMEIPDILQVENTKELNEVMEIESPFTVGLPLVTSPEATTTKNILSFGGFQTTNDFFN